MSAALAHPSHGASLRVVDAIRERYGDWKNAPKRLARAAGTTPRSAENWLSGECSPRIAHLIELMAADEGMEAAVLEIVRGRRAEREG